MAGIGDTLIMSEEIKVLRNKQMLGSDVYLSFLEKFNKKFGNYRPDYITDWLIKHKKSHENLRKVLGGESSKFKIQMKIGQEKLSDKLCKEYAAQITKIMPAFWGTYCISETILKWPMYTHNIDVHGTTKKRQIRTSAFITGYAEKFAKISTENKKILNKILEQLGQHWSKLKDIDKEFLITLSTSPVAFVMIGHYGPDNNSCFRHGKENWKHKFKLSERKDTFVLLISSKNEDNRYKVLARQWGFYNDGMFNICNLYFSKIADGIVEKINHKIFSHLSKQDLKLHRNLISIDKKDIYHNIGKHDWTFAQKEMNNIPVQTLKI